MYSGELESHATAHETGLCTIQVGATGAGLPIGCYVFAEPRRGKLRMFWNLHSLYGFLKLSSYKGQASKWVYGLRSQWRAVFLKILGS